MRDSKATGDAVATGVGVALFCPALFFIKGDSTTPAELARLKGEMEAVEQVSIQKRCGIQFRRAQSGSFGTSTTLLLSELKIFSPVATS